MHVATVIPIARGIPFDTLTYYSSDHLAPGMLVSVPLGKRIISGIVIETIPLIEAKALIKQATFSLKKIRGVIGHLPYFEQVITGLRSASYASLAPIGAIAGQTIPNFLFEYFSVEKTPVILDGDSVSPHGAHESVIIGTTDERSDQYKRLIRTAFAEKKSVIFIAPTIRALSEWKNLLEKGIQKHTILLHSKITKRDLRSAFSLIKSSERPLFILSTPGFLFTPRADLSYLIVEDESSTLYKTSDRFTIDLRIVIKAFADARGMCLVWGDILPRLETLARLNADHLPRSYVPAGLHIVPIEHYRTILPREVIELVLHARKKKRKLFIYTNRKGIAPLSRCSDCYTIVTCPTCTLPMVLRNKVRADGNRERFFICTHCGDTLPATHTCTYCGSWNITPLAIGTESIRDELVSIIGEESVQVIDDDLTPDSAAVEKIVKSIQQKKFAVIIGTTKVLPYLRHIEYTIVPFFDRILSTPSLYTTEQALHLLFEMGERSTSGVIVCTRNPEFPIIRELETQKINGIIHDELAIRKELGYPPYGTIVKISLTVPDGHRQKVVSQLESFFTDMDITALPPRRISMGSMKLLLVWIIKTSTTYIEDEGSRMNAFLDTLRFPYKIEQNPERF